MKRKTAPAKTKAKTAKKKDNKKKKANSSNDIVGLILRDHEPLKKFIEVLKDADVPRSEKQPVFEKFAPTLSEHSKAEEESLYVHLKTEEELKMEGFEGDTEHAIAKRLIEEINDLETDQDEDLWMAKVKVLAELVEHHIEEEETEMLKEVKKELDLETREQIGQEYLQLLNDERREDTDDRKDRTKSKTLNQNRVDYV